MITLIRENKLSALMVVVAALFIAAAGTFALPHTAHSQSSPTPLTGWAWSDTIGWISLNCSTDPEGCSSPAGNWGLSALNGTITGYAWSDTIGWISANPSDLSGCPSGSCSATINGGALQGWLKAIDADNKGWDGWISLNGSGQYSYGPVANSCKFSGFAWGSDVVGWVDFSQARMGSTLGKVCTCTSNTTSKCEYTDAQCNVTDTYTDCSATGETCGGSGTCQQSSQNTQPMATLTAIPSLVVKGNTTTVKWSVTPSDSVSSCKVTGSNSDGTGSTPWTGPSGTEISSAIQGQTIYTLTCIPVDKSYGTVVLMATVGVVPSFQEQ